MGWVSTDSVMISMLPVAGLTRQSMRNERSAWREWCERSGVVATIEPARCDQPIELHAERFAQGLQI